MHDCARWESFCTVVVVRTSLLVHSFTSNALKDVFPFLESQGILRYALFDTPQPYSIPLPAIFAWNLGVMSTETPSLCPTCCYAVISSAKSRHETMRFFKLQFSAAPSSSFARSVVYLLMWSSSIYPLSHRTCTRPFGWPIQPFRSHVLSVFGS